MIIVWRVIHAAPELLLETASKDQRNFVSQVTLNPVGGNAIIGATAAMPYSSKYQSKY